MTKRTHAHRYNHMVLPTLTNLQKAANHLGLLLNRSNPLPGMTVSANRARRTERMDRIAFRGYDECVSLSLSLSR